MKTSTLGKLALAVGVVGLAAIALYIKEHVYDRVETRTIAISGLPCPSGRLETPFWVHGTTRSGYEFGFYYNGGTINGVRTVPQVNIPVGDLEGITIRTGTCDRVGATRIDCAKPTWFGPTQIADLDIRGSRPELKLATLDGQICH